MAQDKRRVIINYKNITNDILQLFTERYPYGYDEEDFIRFTKPSGEKVTAVPLETPDTRYLIKIGTEMDRKIEAFLDDDSDKNILEEGEEFDGTGEDPDD